MINRFPHPTSTYNSDPEPRSRPREPENRSADRAGELIIHRPRTCTAGSWRRFRIELDGHHVANLAYGDTVRIPTYDGPHQLSARCRPLIGTHRTIELAAFETLRLHIHVGTLDQIEICLPNGRAL